jgi:hypothetical protein
MKRVFYNKVLAAKTVKLFFDMGIEFCPIYTGLLIGFCFTDKKGEQQEIIPTDKKSFNTIRNSITDC